MPGSAREGVPRSGMSLRGKGSLSENGLYFPEAGINRERER